MHKSHIHTVLFLEGLFACAKDTVQKRCTSRFPPDRSSHPQSSKPNSEWEWGAICNKVLSQQCSMPESADWHLQHCYEQWSMCQLTPATLMWAVKHVWIWWMTSAPLLWAVKHVWIRWMTPAPLLWAVKHVWIWWMTPATLLWAVKHVWIWWMTPATLLWAVKHLQTASCQTASGESEMVPTAQEITMNSDLSSSQIKMMTLVHIVDLQGLLYSDLYERVCVKVAVWGGSGGRSNFLSVLGVSNTFRTCVQQKQRFEKKCSQPDIFFFFFNNSPALT